MSRRDPGGELLAVGLGILGGLAAIALLGLLSKPKCPNCHNQIDQGVTTCPYCHIPLQWGH